MTKLTENQAKELQILQQMKDDEIDFSDIPLTVDWSKAVACRLHRPLIGSNDFVIRLTEYGEFAA